MRLMIDFGSDLPEPALNFFIHTVSTAGKFVPLKGNQTLQNVQDEIWKINKPLEMVYSFT